MTFQQEGSYFPLTRNVHNQNFIEHNKTIQKKERQSTDINMNLNFNPITSQSSVKNQILIIK